MSKFIFIFLCFASLSSFGSFDSKDFINSGLLTKRFNLENLLSISEKLEYEANNELALYDRSFSVKKTINKVEVKNLTQAQAPHRIKLGRFQFSKSKYKIFHGTISGDFIESNYQLKYKLFQHHGLKIRPLIFVFPPIMGNTHIDKSVAKKLVNKGANVVLVEMESLFEEKISIKDLSNKFYYTLYLLKQLVESSIQNPELNIDHDRVGVFGLSLGGIVGATLAGISPSVKRLYVIGASGNLPLISFNSTRRSISIFRENSMTKNSLIDAESWANFSKPYFRKLDPLNYIENYKEKKIFMLMSPSDTTVPFTAQAQFWKALGQPDYRLYDMSHISMIIRWFIEDQGHMLDFFID